MNRRRSEPLSALLMRRVRFLLLMACVFAVFGGLAELLDVADPYPLHPFISDHHQVPPVQPLEAS